MSDVVSITDPTAQAKTEHVSFQYRLNFFHPEMSYGLEADGMTITGKATTSRVRYAEIVSITVHPEVRKALQGWQHLSRCIVKTRGKAYPIQSAHFAGWGTFEDRSKDYETFVTHLLYDARRANPALVVLSGAPFGTWLAWLIVAVFCGICGVCGLFILPSGLALTMAGLTGLFQAWSVLQKGYAHPVDPATIFHDPVKARADFQRDTRRDRR